MSNEFRLDDYANLAAGLGTTRDKHTAVTFLRRRRLDRLTLEALYEQDPIVARIVDMPVDTAFRTPFHVRTDAAPSEEIRKWLKDLQAVPRTMELLKWGRLYGGALAMIPAIDGCDTDQALRLAEGVRVHPLAVVAAHDAIPQYMDTAFGSPTYGKVLDYHVTGLSGRTIHLHHTRAIAHEPIALPPDVLMRSGRQWGPSIVERVFDALSKDGASAGYATAMMYVASILYLKLDDWRRKISTKEGRAKGRELLAEFRSALDSLGIAAIDAKDEIGTLDLSATGAHELVDKMRDRLAAAVDGMPREILLNESPSGLRGGELSGAQAIFFGSVQALRENTISPILDRLIEIALVTRGIMGAEWEIEWEPLWQPREDEAAATDKLRAEASAIRVNAATRSPDEIRAEEGYGPPADDAEPLELDPGAVAAHEAELDASTAEALLGIAERVNAGQLGRSQALALIAAAYPSAAQAAEGIVGEDAPAPPVPQAGDLVRVQEAATRLGVPTRAITRAIELGQLPARGIGRHRLVSLAEVAALLEGGAPAPAPAPSV